MDATLTPLTAEDADAAMAIFNHYVEHTFAAYPEQALPTAFFQNVLDMAQGYPTVAARDEGGTLVGFALLRPFNPIPTFARTAEITLFLKPDWTGKGLGTRMLETLVSGAREQGITSILASVSSRNEGSIAFHGRNGFQQVGCFTSVGIKKGEPFDVVWLQRIL